MKMEGDVFLVVRMLLSGCCCCCCWINSIFIDLILSAFFGGLELGVFACVFVGCT